MIIHWLTRFYRLLLLLYPPQFRQSFGEEMQQVFAESAGEAQRSGGFSLLRMWLHELAGLPAAWLNSRQSEAANRLPDRRSIPGEHSWQELALLLTIFLLPAALALINQPNHQPASSASLLAAFFFLAIMLVFGYLGGFPLWSLRYIGIIFVVAIYLLVFNWVAGLLTPALVANFTPGRLDTSSYLLLNIASTGMVWLMLFCLTLLAAASLALLNRFQPLLAPFRSDWTQLSYILYGESVFALILLHQSQRFHANYALAALLCLLAGIWFYLRSSSGAARLAILVGCLTLSVWIGIFDLRSVGQGESLLSWEVLNGSDLGRLLLSWLGMLAALLAPALLSRLPSRTSTYSLDNPD